MRTVSGTHMQQQAQSGSAELHLGTLGICLEVVGLRAFFLASKKNNNKKSSQMKFLSKTQNIDWIATNLQTLGSKLNILVGNMKLSKIMHLINLVRNLVFLM